jgi:hypothetical protein
LQVTSVDLTIRYLDILFLTIEIKQMMQQMIE